MTQYAVKVWQDGLPQLTVTALAQTPDRHLWAGTQEGLARFDGESFVAFDRRRVPELPSGWILSLVPRPDGSLWWSDRDGNLLRREPSGAIRRLEAGKELPRLHAQELVTEGNDRCWVVTLEGIVVRVDGQEVRTWGPAEGVPRTRLFTATLDRAGTFWIGTHSAGLLRFANGRFEPFGRAEGFPDSGVQSLLEDADGNLLAGTQESGLVRLRDTPVRKVGRFEGLRAEFVRTVFPEADGSLLVGSAESGGPWRVRDGRATLEPVPGVRIETVASLMRDRAGFLWIGTGAQGLVRWKSGVAPLVLTDGDGLRDRHVTALAEGPDGTIWAGTEGGGLHRIVGGRVAPAGPERELETTWVSGLVVSRDGSLWIATVTAGLARLSGGTLSRWRAGDGLPGDSLFALHEDARGDLWLGTLGHGIARMRDGRFAAVTERQGLFDDVVMAVAEDRHGALWLSSNRGICRVAKRELDAVLDGKAARVTPRVFGLAGVQDRERRLAAHRRRLEELVEERSADLRRAHADLARAARLRRSSCTSPSRSSRGASSWRRVTASSCSSSGAS